MSDELKRKLMAFATQSFMLNVQLATGDDRETEKAIDRLAAELREIRKEALP